MGKRRRMRLRSPSRMRTGMGELPTERSQADPEMDATEPAPPCDLQQNSNRNKELAPSVAQPEDPTFISKLSAWGPRSSEAVSRSELGGIGFGSPASPSPPRKLFPTSSDFGKCWWKALYPSGSSGRAPASTSCKLARLPCPRKVAGTRTRNPSNPHTVCPSVLSGEAQHRSCERGPGPMPLLVVPRDGDCQ